ncbi:unnamed protein product [Closterium sp. NIES-53]
MVPAFVYTVQNVLINIAYRHLHPVTFAMLSQTKLLFTALFNFIFLRQKQSGRQVLALLAMLVAAVLLSIADHVQLSLSLFGGEGAGEGTADGKGGKDGAGSGKDSAGGGGGSGGLTESLAASVLFGAIPMLAASVTSGFGSMYCQWVSQVRLLSFYLLLLVAFVLILFHSPPKSSRLALVPTDEGLRKFSLDAVKSCHHVL